MNYELGSLQCSSCGHIVEKMPSTLSGVEGLNIHRGNVLNLRLTMIETSRLRILKFKFVKILWQTY